MNKPLILIVEDDKPIRNLISLTLESQQYRQIAVETGGAAVIGDTVGDPCKDTCGPSLNILIKLMSMVSVVFTPLIITFAPVIQQALGLTAN